MPAVLEWSPTVDPSEFVLQVREALAAGSLVALPGDVGYFVLANPAADATEGHLRTLAGIADATPCFLSYGPEDAPCELPTIARRLMLRAWPAPLVVAVGTAHGELRFRCPDHPALDATDASKLNRRRIAAIDGARDNQHDVPGAGMIECSNQSSEILVGLVDRNTQDEVLW